MEDKWSLAQYGARPYSGLSMGEQPHGSFNVTMDVGSTSERSLVYPDDLTWESDVLVVPSPYTPLNRDTSNIKSASSAIEDNLEIVITPQDKEHYIGESIRIFKGSLREALGGTFVPMSSANSKVDQHTTYINVYASLAMTLLYTMLHDQRFVHDCNVKLTVSLPCEDLENVERKNIFVQRLCGKVHVAFPRLGPGIGFNITIKPEDILVDSETNAVIYAYFAKHERTQEETVLFIEGGGRNLAFGCVKDGVILQDKLISTAGGGTKFHDLVGKAITNKLGLQKPPNAQIEKILDCGYLRDGAAYVDATSAIDEAKEEYTTQLMSGVLQALDQAELAAENIQRVVCNGRLFKPTIYRNVEGQVVSVSKSIMENLRKAYSVQSPKTAFELLGADESGTITTDYPIPSGLVAIRLESEYGGME